MDSQDSSDVMETHGGDFIASCNTIESESSRFHEAAVSFPVVSSMKTKSDFRGEDEIKETVKDSDYSEEYNESQSSQNSYVRKVHHSGPHSLTERTEKMQMIKPLQKEMYSQSVPILAASKKHCVFPLKKKTPVMLRNIYQVTERKDQVDEESDSEVEIRDIDNVRITGNSQNKTICISENALEDISSKSSLSFINMQSQERFSYGSSSSNFNSGSSARIGVFTKKTNSTLTRASASPASPYNTRFAHMKVGNIFSDGDKSGVKRKINRKIAVSHNENSGNYYAPVVTIEKSEIEDCEASSGICFLCKIAFDNDMGVTLNVKKPLPLSKIDFVTLLESFGISCAPLEKDTMDYVNICNVCHTLVLDGDGTYKQLLSVASEMKEQWPSRITKKDPVLSLKIPDSSICPLYSNQSSSKSNLASSKRESNITMPIRPRGRVGRPPKKQVKVEDEKDENWRPAQVKVEVGMRTRRRGRPPKGMMKKRGRGRPRKLVIKGEVSDGEIYTCGLCGESFEEENEWTCHFQTAHKMQLRWVKYNLQKKLKKLIFQHIQQSFVHDEYKETSCPACNVKFYERSAYIEHLRSFHNMLIDEDFVKALHDYSQGIYNINDISASETEREDNDISSDGVVKIKKEIISNDVVEKPTYKCKVCNLALYSEKALKEHTDTSHFSLVVIANDNSKEVVLPDDKKSENDVNEKNSPKSTSLEATGKENVEDSELKCEDCKEVFQNRHKFLEHKLNVHGHNEDDQEQGLVRYECEVCERRIYGLAALRVHMSKVHYKTQSSFKHCCNMCIYKSQSRSQLGKHMKNKHGKEIMPSVQCETCGKMYGPSYIAKHIATMHSTQPRNFQCNFCDMKFYDLAGLKFHIYHEHANKVWKCNKCPMEFKKYHQLRQHRIFLHSNKVHTCPDCCKTFKRKGDLTEHIKRLHSQRVVLLCPRCPKQYVNRFKLRNHLMKHHDVPWEDTLARNYARHQRANNCRRTEEGILELNKDQPNTEDRSVIIEESYSNFERREIQDSEQFEGHFEEHEYSDSLGNEEHEYHAHYRHRGRPKTMTSVKMEEPEEEEYIEIMEATDAFAKDGITYVIIEEA